MEKIEFIISEQFNNLKISDFLRYYHVGKKTIYQYSFEKRILLNDIVSNSEKKMKTGDKLIFLLEENNEKHGLFNQAINIVYEDQDILIIDKDINLLVHTDGTNQINLTDIINSNKNVKHKILPAHRLDVDTSGLIVFGKHFISISYLSHLFENHLVEKIYHAYLSKPLKVKEGALNFRLGYDSEENKMMSRAYGKEALTLYKTLIDGDKPKIEVKLITGRTHQIRAHFSAIGAPVVGDKIYGVKGDRLMLHAYKMTLENLNGQKIVIESKRDFNL